jgi:hypothetical protein
MTPSFRKLIFDHEKSAEQGLHGAIEENQKSGGLDFRKALRRHRIMVDKLWKEIFGGKDD